MTARAVEPPLVAHVLYRFAVGGTENGVVNLINSMPRDSFRHAVISLTGIDASFAGRLRAGDIELIAVDKGPGHGWRCYGRLYRLFRSLRPSIVHTRNLAALEAVLPAWAAGVPARIHGEHGWDIADPEGRNSAYRWVRRVYRPFVDRYVAVSQGLVGYLRGIGVPASRIECIYNGVDTGRFQPRDDVRPTIADCPFGSPHEWLVGTVGRMQAIKDQLTLVRAFIHAVERAPDLEPRLRLLLVGDGPLRQQAIDLLARARLDHRAWLPGERRDIPAVMRGLDCFVLPSLAEGISNTALEAMACGLPVVATRVGGNSEIVVPGETGELVPANDPSAMAAAIVALARAPERARALGRAGRSRAEQLFALDAMVARYQRLYETMLTRATGAMLPMGSAH